MSAVQLFYKYFDTFVVDRNLIPQPFDYTNFPLPQFSPGVPWQTTNPALPNFLPPAGITNGEISAPYNVKGGKMYGIELGTTIPFGDFIPLLDGFGFTGGASYTKSRIHPYVRRTGDGSAWLFEVGAERHSLLRKVGLLGPRQRAAPLELHRVKCPGFGANRTLRRRKTRNDCRRSDRLRIPAGQFHERTVDLSAGAKPDERAVRDEDGSGNPLQIIDYQRYGRRWMLGAIVQVRRCRTASAVTAAASTATASASTRDADVRGRSVILATEACPAPPPPPPPPPPAPERG